jgi:hypothetical protein
MPFAIKKSKPAISRRCRDFAGASVLLEVLSRAASAYSKLAHEKFTLFQSNPYHPLTGLAARLTEKRVAFFALSHIIPLMSLAELKEAVAALSPADLAELASFIRQRENSEWDRQIDADFAEGGRLRPVLEEVRENLRAGRLEDLP